ncbi:Biosynthetic peptidoglycan transglycosylase [Austwickia sp. TVS 96-490-7B]|uniref:transglycosylase domain-containing protein n=1 Tax=Austwickia sp. TVS 96-490-7B TaxID=2830843 RepID=UPI001C58460D|nr:transglycosylase domain-containing protein [Austwickia sp. TVS 96-490-7B]MBW3084933.1 Biosynthetic peptidoglycan transglycosylase [Austwickia sp. TVS 96-490-7B]
MQRRAGAFTNVFSLLAAFVAASMVLGLLAAGLAIPAVGGMGASTKLAINTFDALPATLTAPAMAQQTRIEANDGTLLATLFTENRTIVSLDQVSPIMRKAQVAIEDDRFYEHGGIDTRGIMRAFVATMRGDTQGASTITQQYVRQSLIANALRNGNKDAADAAQQQRGVAGVVRKLQEAKYAIELEKKMPKDKVLEGYLNLVFYGANAYGIQAAAQRYFGVDAKDLNLQQSAMIAGMAQLPTAYNPMERPKAAMDRRNSVLDRMAALNVISREDAAKAKAAPLGLNVQPLKKSCESAADKWVCLYVQKWLVKNVPALGKNEAEREANLLRGGLTVRTTFDVNVLKQSRAALVAKVPESDWKSVGAAAAVVEPGTGKVLSIAQSSAQSNDLIWSVDSEYGRSGGFQIGSTAKMYGVVAALKKGWRGDSPLNAPAPKTPFSYSQLGAGECGMGNVGTYAPGNAEQAKGGSMTLQQATMTSINTAFVELATKIGVCSEKATMKDMGLHTADGQPYGKYPSLILGSDNASPLTLAASYATLAAGGKYCAPYPVESITQYDGKKIPFVGSKCRKTEVTPQVAFNATQILKTVGPWSHVNLADGRPAGSKSGTADESKHTWYAGYTPQRAAAVWVGRPAAQTAMEGVQIGGQYYGVVYGATIAGPLWAKVMDAASQGLPVEQFKVDTDRTDGKIVVPDLKGSTEEDAKNTLQAMDLQVQIADQRVPQEGIGPGLVVSSSPGPGAELRAGNTVTLTLTPAPKPTATTSTGTAQPRPGASPSSSAKPSASTGGASSRPGRPGRPGSENGRP